MEPFNQSQAMGLGLAAEAMASLRGRPTTAKTLDLWIRTGYRPKGHVGERIKLPSVMVDGRRMVMRSWLVDFQRRRLAMGRPSDGPTTGQARRAHERAVADLEAMGFRVGGPA